MTAMPRDTTRALALVRSIQDAAADVNRWTVELIHILEDIDARETRRDPSKRPRRNATEPQRRKRGG
jgi:hypothetical protein